MTIQLRLAAICLGLCLLAPGPAAAKEISPAEARQHLAALIPLVSEFKAVPRSGPMGVIAVAWSRTGDIDGAFEFAREFQNHYVRAVTLFHLATHYSDKGDVKQALAIAREIRNSYYRVKTYSSIAQAQAIIGDKAGARQSLRTAQMALPGVPKEFDVRGTIAVALVAIGEEEQAKELLDKLEFESRPSAYLGATLPLVELSEYFTMARMIDRALGIAREMVKNYNKPLAFYAIVMRLIDSGDLVTAQRIVRDMPRDSAFIASAIISQGLWAAAFARLANAQVDAGDQSGALDTIEEAFSVLRNESAPITNDAAFEILVPSLAKAGEITAAQLFTSLISDVDGQVNAMAAIAMELAKSSDLPQARSMLRRAMIIPDAYPTVKFAEAEAWTGNIQGAIGTARGLPTQKERADAFKGIAQAIGEMAARSLAR